MQRIGLVRTLVCMFLLLAGCNGESYPQEEHIADNIVSVVTWQESYATLLQEYAEKTLAEMEESWHFILHDIDKNGIPELILVLIYETGHILHHSVYTHRDDSVVSLEFQSFVTDGAIFVPIDNSPWIVMYYPVGSGAIYQKVEMDGNRCVTVAEGTLWLSGEGLERNEGMETSSYEWYVLTLNGNPATSDEFESEFGGFSDREWLVPSAIIEANIQNIIFGW